MSMLSEARRKRIVTPNPQGNFFTQDEANKGRAMLRQMGWQEGQGLGKTSQGISAPIKPKINTSTKGLGYEAKVDAWIKHSEKFSQVLVNLNNETSGDAEDDNTASAQTTTTTSDDMVSKSKTSKSRIHYKKFVENKDLSNASEKDMAAIFGKPVSQSGDYQGKPEQLKANVPNTNVDYSLSARSKFLSDVFMEKRRPIYILNWDEVPFASKLPAKFRIGMTLPYGLDPVLGRIWSLQARMGRIPDEQFREAQRLFKTFKRDILLIKEEARVRTPKLPELTPGQGWFLYLRSGNILEDRVGPASMEIKGKVFKDSDARRAELNHIIQNQMFPDLILSGGCKTQAIEPINKGGQEDMRPCPSKKRKSED